MNDPVTAHGPARRAVSLEELTWLEAEKALTPDAVVVLPLGATSKEHGPHLKLSNDARMASYLAARLGERSAVVLAPLVGFHHYPSFAEYPGSISLRAETARDLIVDIVKSLARSGPRRFYVLNTGVSTVKPLRAAAEELAKEGILLRFTDLLRTLGPVEKEVAQQEGGTHADELETSMMLVIDPASVDLSKAVKDFHPDGGPLTRNPSGPGTYSPTGTWGDPSLATRAKGERLVAALVAALVADVEALRSEPIPPRP